MNLPITVFISYSWEDEIHNKKVERFVRLLKEHNIHVLFDRDMVLGERFTDFMEMINKSNFVLFLCTPTYREKANKGVGGVKYEKNIITAELYEKGNETKFIPILFSGTWNESLPIWAKGKLGIDYREESAAEFKRLLDNLNKSEIIQANIFPSGEKKGFHTKKKLFALSVCILCLVIACILYHIFFNKIDLIKYENKPYELIECLDYDLRKLLGNEFEYFAECFYTMGTIGECTLYEDGIFIRGFVPGIASYMGGILCIDTDGYLYVFLIDGEEKILYYTNNADNSSSLPLTKFNHAISNWLEDYSDYYISFQSSLFENQNIEGLYVREYAQIEVIINEDNTITITGDAFRGANMGTLECTTELLSYPDGAYAKYFVELDGEPYGGQYIVFYFGNNSVSILDRAPFFSGAGVSFGGEYNKIK